MICLLWIDVRCSTNEMQIQNCNELTGMIAPQTPTGSCLVKHTKFSSVGRTKKKKRRSRGTKRYNTLSSPLIYNHCFLGKLLDVSTENQTWETKHWEKHTVTVSMAHTKLWSGRVYMFCCFFPSAFTGDTLKRERPEVCEKSGQQFKPTADLLLASMHSFVRPHCSPSRLALSPRSQISSRGNVR